MSLMKRILFLPILCLIHLFYGCNANNETLTEVERIIDEHPDSALYLLDYIDPSNLSARQRAQYALLYTKAQYKNYIDAPNDSLISIAVDYYEMHGSDEEKFYAYLYQGIVRYWTADYTKATFSLLQSLRNSDDISNHYSKGQMFTYLALTNTSQQCSDDALYARKAYHEYNLGNLDVYAASALVTLAVAKLHNQEDDSCRYFLEKSIAIAQRENDELVLNDALSQKMFYAITVDSLILAKETSEMLLANPNYKMTSRDLAIHAYFAAKNNDNKSVETLLDLARQNCKNYNDSTTFYVLANWAYREMNQPNKAYKYQDSLLHYEEKMLSEGLKHTALAAQRDYAEEQLIISGYKHKMHIYSLSIFIILLLAISTSLYFEAKKRRMYIQLQNERIENLQYKLRLQGNTLREGERNLKKDPFVTTLCSPTHQTNHLTSDEWNILYSLFCKYIPHFENSLKELSSLSETEWHVCMLIKLNIAPSSIAILMSKTPGAISSMRERLYKKVFGKRGSTKEWDDFIKSI